MIWVCNGKVREDLQEKKEKRRRMKGCKEEEEYEEEEEEGRSDLLRERLELMALNTSAKLWLGEGEGEEGC